MSCFLTPNVMNVVQSSDLGEESPKGLIVVLSKINGPCPIVSPFNHRPWLESVTTDFINVVSLPRLDGWPETKWKKELCLSQAKTFKAFLQQLLNILTNEKHELIIERDTLRRILTLFSFRIFREVSTLA